MGASRWRTWDVDCLEETLLSRAQDDEVEPLIAVGSRREIPRVDFSSLVLPKEALFTTNDNHIGRGSRSRGRGRSLANRALGFDRPSRRPGERDTSEASPKPTLGLQFFGSEYLYEELFPSLDQLTCTKEDLKPPIQSKSVWDNKRKTKKESSNQPSVRCSEEKSVTGDKSISNQTNFLDTATNNKDKESSLSYYYCVREDTVISENEDNFVETSDITSVRNALQHDKIMSGIIQNNEQLEYIVDTSECVMTRESEDILEKKQPEELNELPEKLGFVDHQNSTFIEEDFSQEVGQQQLIHHSNNNEAKICIQLPTNPNDEISICEEIKQDAGDTGRNNGSTDSTTNEQYFSNGHLTIQQDAKTDHGQPVDDNDISSITNTLPYSPSQPGFEEPNNHKHENYLETNDTKENLEDSLDTSANGEMDPCNILLENLPLALSEEELAEIVEPYGEAVSFNFKEKDNASKQCIARMPSSVSGELLVVSLDGLELDGYRIKATMVDS